jgi:NADH-quinone oxidoreductase subunit H
MEILSNLLVEKTVIVVIVFTISLLTAMYSTYAERKISALFQDRVGPNRAGIFGILQPLADGGKLIFKEEIIPISANKFLFILGPSLTMFTACMTSAVIPWGTFLEYGDRHINLQVTDLNIGILYIFAVVSTGVYGFMIGGWSSNNKYSLMGAIRASSQMISYEVAMGMSVVALIMLTGTMSLREVVEQQTNDYWYIVYQPLGFLIFMICSFAETNRTPFDLPECEAELVGGYHTEYSSMKLGLFLFAEYVNMFISSAVMSALYFGGYDIPYIELLELPQNVVAMLGFGFFFFKIICFIFFFMWVRWTLPRFRYDQLMNLGWKILIPLSILNVIITGAMILLFN